MRALASSSPCSARPQPPRLPGLRREFSTALAACVAFAGFGFGPESRAVQPPEPGDSERRSSPAPMRSSRAPMSSTRPFLDRTVQSSPGVPPAPTLGSARVCRRGRASGVSPIAAPRYAFASIVSAQPNRVVEPRAGWGCRTAHIGWTAGTYQLDRPRKQLVKSPIGNTFSLLQPQAKEGCQSDEFEDRVYLRVGPRPHESGIERAHSIDRKIWRSFDVFRDAF